MRKVLHLLAFLIISLCGNAQLLSWSPSFIQESSNPVVITTDATMGNQGLLNYGSSVYVHIGVITNYSTSSSDWKHVPAFCVWGTTNASALCASAGTNKWSFTINGGLRSFFNITDPAEKITHIAVLFRSGDGNKKQANTDGTDMYVPVYDNGLYVRIDNPYSQPKYVRTLEPITKAVGNTIAINANASQSSALKIFFNGSQVATATATTISANPTITAPGAQTIIAEADNGTTVKRDTISFFVNGSVNVAPLPAGMQDGINYDANGTTATLVLYAPAKSRISVVGDFNNWTETLTHQMNKTPDGNRWWLQLTGLTPGQEYGYQYIIDGSLKVADYNAEKILDPANDPYIDGTTYPGLKPYPTGLTTGIVSVLQTAKPVYNWQNTSFARPDKRNLVVYELLLRDFVAAHNWQTLKDTLTYLKRLGVNAIEVMPFNEFEGNISWGYNPSFYFAPDKYYGTETAIKQFVDACHAQGIAVIMDMVMNHAYGQSPMVQMYWDGTNNKPAANSPWFNPDYKHPYSVGYDFNHESQATKDLVARVVRHWLTKYKLDGFRWDLSKGFTQTYSGSDENLFAQYDAGRIATWKRIYDTMQNVSSGSYCILEHFAVNSEEIELSNYGMLLWGNSNHNFSQATSGKSDWNFQYGIFTNRGWTNPYLVTYMESHDEERLMYLNEQEGLSNGSYNIKDVNTGLKRNEMATAFWSMIPGPKMMWQFGETGYDFTINRCEDGSVNNGCRTNPKPIRWDYYQNANRQALYEVYRKLIKLKVSPIYSNTFVSSNITWSLSGGFKWMLVNEPSLRVMVLGNFDVVPQTSTVTFPTAGTWYSYLTGSTRTATGAAQSVTLQPGEYYVYTDKNVADVVLTLPVNPVTPVLPSRDSLGYINDIKLQVNPNPVRANATIEYSTLRNGHLTMSITDMNGRNMAVLLDNYQVHGTFRFNLSEKMAVQRLTAGMYLLQAELNGKKRIEKFIVTTP